MSANESLPRNFLALIISAIIIFLLVYLKPEVTVHERKMFLPVISNKEPVESNAVRSINFSESFLYNKIGYITIIAPDFTNDGNAKYKIIAQAKQMAADAGATRLLIEGPRTSDWFDTGQRIIRLQAIAYSQS